MLLIGLFEAVVALSGGITQLVRLNSDHICDIASFMLQGLKHLGMFGRQIEWFKVAAILQHHPPMGLP